SVSVLGLAARVNITNAEAANDSLVISAQSGDDTVTATALPATVIKLTVDAGTGNDSVFGSQGNDTVLGGDGNDFIDGNQGSDLAEMGAGDDVFQWDPGDGNDTIEGQDGTDTMVFNGANIAEKIDILANGARVRFTRDIGSIVMDLADTEKILFTARAGVD